MPPLGEVSRMFKKAPRSQRGPEATQGELDLYAAIIWALWR
jgi:hypothetical protein